MLSECMDGLNIKPEGIYVDVTFGGGGHSLKILEQLREGRLIAFDQDEDAKKQADNIQSRSFTFCQENFRYMKQYLKLNGVTKVDGILADLGISSHQIDSPERGFSTRFDGPLDMRMNKKAGVTAAKLLNEYSGDKLHKIFGMYGEVKNAKTLARAIDQQRVIKKFCRTQTKQYFIYRIAGINTDSFSSFLGSITKNSEMNVIAVEQIRESSQFKNLFPS